MFTRLLSLFALMVLVTTHAAGQQIPLYSQYYYNPFLYNPARVGEKDAVQLYLVYRKQWVDFKGAPETRTISLDGRIKDKIGLGGYVYSDLTNIVERLGGQIAYAYYFSFGEHKLSLGISAGAQETKVDFSRVIVDDPNEALLATGLQKGVNFDASAGVSYWFKGLQVGFSVPQILGTKINYDNNDDKSYEMARHYLATASYDIPVIKDVFYIAPNAMFRTTDQFNTFQVDGGAIFRYKELAWVSAMYRYDCAVSFGAGIRLHDRVSVGYAYDMALNDLKDYGGGTHELLVGIKFGKRENEGLAETIQSLQNKQQEQAAAIEQLKSDTDTLKEENKNIKKSIDDQDAEIRQLKNEINKAVQEFQDSLTIANEELLQLQQDYLKGIKKSEIKTDNPPTQKYLLVVKTYKNEEIAQRKADELKKQNFDVAVFFFQKKGHYYIYLKDMGGIKPSLQKLNQLKHDTEFKDAWIFYVEE